MTADVMLSVAIAEGISQRDRFATFGIIHDTESRRFAMHAFHAFSRRDSASFLSG